jgi:AcrR family transcriptional regulator
MTRVQQPQPRPRERLLAAAARLFVHEGIHSVGVDRLSDEAHVSKRSLYQHFGTKDAIVTAMLEDYGPRVLGAYLSTENDGLSPRDRILGVFDAQHAFAESPAYMGCPFVNLATELRDREHPASQTARGFKLALTSFFELQAGQLGAAEPATLATQLTMIFDGAGAHAAMNGGGIPAAARQAVETLIDGALSD